MSLLKVFQLDPSSYDKDIKTKT